MASDSGDYENLIVDYRDTVATITINRPDVLNALNAETTRELGEAVDLLAADDRFHVLIITGAGEQAFVAGADISVLATYDPVDAREAARFGQATFDKIEECGKPVIAAINGYALGGGFELALACHIRFAAEGAQMGLPEINLGVIPGHGGTQRVTRLLGKGAAIELVCSGAHVNATDALSLGLVNAVHPADSLMEAVYEFAAKLAGKPRIAMRYALEAVNQGLNVTLKEGQAIEADLFGLCFATEDQTEGMNAFLEKRKANWKGR